MIAHASRRQLPALVRFGFAPPAAAPILVLHMHSEASSRLLLQLAVYCACAPAPAAACAGALLLPGLTHCAAAMTARSSVAASGHAPLPRLPPAAAPPAAPPPPISPPPATLTPALQTELRPLELRTTLNPRHVRLPRPDVQGALRRRVPQPGLAAVDEHAVQVWPWALGSQVSALVPRLQRHFRPVLCSSATAWRWPAPGRLKGRPGGVNSVLAV